MPEKWKTKWKSKDGQVIRIKDMTDTHLLNTARFLLKQAQIIINRNIEQYYSGMQPQGEMAEIEFDRELSAWESMTPEDYLEEECPAFENMVKELEKRGLEIEVKR